MDKGRRLRNKKRAKSRKGKKNESDLNNQLIQLNNINLYNPNDVNSESKNSCYKGPQLINDDNFYFSSNQVQDEKNIIPHKVLFRSI